MKTFRPLMTGTLGIRGEDEWGSGAFAAPRGDRTHRGLDIVVAVGADVLAPISGEIVREAKPYEDDDRYGGILIRGAGPWHGLELKLFYIEGYSRGPILAGDVLGKAQDLSLKYPGITNHVHIEVWQHDHPINPTPFFADLLT